MKDGQMKIKDNIYELRILRRNTNLFQTKHTHKGNTGISDEFEQTRMCNKQQALES